MSSKKQAKQNKKLKVQNTTVQTGFGPLNKFYQQTCLCGLCRSLTVHVQYCYSHQGTDINRRLITDVEAQVASHKTAICHTWRWERAVNFQIQQIETAVSFLPGGCEDLHSDFLEYKPLNWWWLEGQKGQIKIKCHQGGIKQSQIRVLPADLRQTNGWWKADSVLMRTEAGALFRACTLTEACFQDTTLVAASNSPSWRQIKTSSSIYRNASHRIFLLGDRYMFTSRGLDICRWEPQA